MTRPCFAKTRFASFATASSAAPRNAGSASSTVVSAPSRRQTLPISRPITPAPTTPSRFGTSVSASAPALSSTRTLSNGTPGSGRGAEPVATITCVALNFAGFGPSTSMLQPASAPPPANEPRPWKNATLFFLNRNRMPSLFCATTLSFRASMRGTSMREALDVDAVVGERMSRVVEVLGRLQRAPSTGCSRHWCTCRRARACRLPASSRRCTPSGSRVARSGWRRCSPPGPAPITTTSKRSGVKAVITDPAAGAPGLRGLP